MRRGPGQPARELLGKQFGVFRVMARAEKPGGFSDEHAYWRVECVTCGYSKVVSSQNIVRFFAMKCNHVPHGHRVVGPKDVAALDALRALDRVSVSILESSGWQPLAALAEAVDAMGGD